MSVQHWNERPDEVVRVGEASVYLARLLSDWEWLDPALHESRRPLARLDSADVPLCWWIGGPVDDIQRHVWPWVRAVLVGSETRPGEDWELWSPVVPWVRSVLVLLSRQVWVRVTPIGTCIVAETALVSDVVRLLRLFTLPGRVPRLSVGVTRAFRGHFVARDNGGWHLEQWCDDCHVLPQCPNRHTVEDDDGAAASSALFVLECLQRAGPRPLTLSADSNIYGRLARADLDRLFLPLEDARALELDPEATLTLRSSVPSPLAGVPVFVRVTWTRPVPYTYQALYDALSVATRGAGDAPRIQRRVPTAMGAVDLTWPHDGGGVLVLSVAWAAGVHREDQPLLAADMDKDVAGILGVLRALRAGQDEGRQAFSPVRLTEAAAAELPKEATKKDGDYMILV